jgi:hypothetical protein
VTRAARVWCVGCPKVAATVQRRDGSLELVQIFIQAWPPEGKPQRRKMPVVIPLEVELTHAGWRVVDCPHCHTPLHVDHTELTAAITAGVDLRPPMHVERPFPE